MAEIGIVASIVGVAGAGFRLSLILNAISCEIVQAPLEIHHISKSVTLFSLMLKQTGTVLQAADSVHSHEAVEAAKQIADESNRVFDEINEMLDRLRSKKADGTFKPTAQQRIKWCFKKSRITYLLGQLESLKLSLNLMLQILQLGKMMASTSKSDSPEVVTDRLAAIQQERAEVQNTLVVRHMQVKETNMPYRDCERDELSPQSPIEPRDDMDDDSRGTVTLPPQSISSANVVWSPLHSLGEVDQILQQMENSSKDMVTASDRAVDPLLDKWTRWKEIRETQHTRHANGKYMPTVHHWPEDDLLYNAHGLEREESPRVYYLEGTTTDWRKPNSVAARQEYIRRKRQYARYQPSVSAHSSDHEDSPASNASRKRNLRPPGFSTDSDSSDSEHEVKEKKPPTNFQPGPPLDRSTPAQRPSGQFTPPHYQLPPGMLPSPAPSTGSKPPPSPQYKTPPGSRTYPVPDQKFLYYSASMPLPPVSTYNAPNPYSHPYAQPPAYGRPSAYPSERPVPIRTYPPVVNQMDVQTRSTSGDTRFARSTSPLAQESSRDRDWSRRQDRERDRYRSSDREGDRDKDRYRFRDRDRDRDRDHFRQEKKSRDSRSKALRDGATKGLLGAGALSIFLEALGELDI